MDRKYNIKLDLQFRCNNSLMKFSEFDNNTSDFFMRITNNFETINIDKALVVLATIKPSGKVSSQFVEVKDGLVYADLDKTMKDEVGTYKAQVMLILQNERVVTDVVSYEVTEDKIFGLLNDTVATTEEYNMLLDALNRLSTIETDEEQRQINEAERILQEEQRQINENSRIEAELIRQHEEADRTKYDAIREYNEEVRKTNETKRQTNEDIRLQNEANRVTEENKRVLAEQDRKDNYNFMTEDEERRRLEANAHNEAEKLRVVAETNRVNEESKRRTVEQARVASENTRKQNESTRESNEVTRKANEQSRVQAETERSNRYNSFIVDAEANVNNFENYTNQAKTYEEERKINEVNRITYENKRQSNESTRITNENQRNHNERNRTDSESVRSREHSKRMNEATEKIEDIENRYSKLGTEKQQEKEVIDARGDSESLREELVRIETKSKEIYDNVEGTFNTVRDSIVGNIFNIEILGNTWQDPSDLSNIVSSGILRSDGQYEMSISCCNKNLNDNIWEMGSFASVNGEESNASNIIRNKNRFIKVKPNTQYIFGVPGVDRAMFFYDENKKYISGGTGNMNNVLFQIPANCHYINIRVVSTDLNIKLQLEENSVATSYEKHQFIKYTISLPCALEKVGDVADRLYYDKVEKAWCIEKNIANIKLSSNQISTVMTTTSEYFDFTTIINIPNIIYGSYLNNIFISGFKTLTVFDNSINSTYSTTDKHIVKFAKGTTIEQARDILFNANIKYMTNNPQKIILPLSTQLALNSFFGTTHIWSEAGKVDVTIKASVPKSTQASLQSLHNKTDILDDRLTNIEGLKESQNMTYETDKGYVVAQATQNGVVKDIKLYGKTVVVDVEGNIVEAGTQGATLKSVGEDVDKIEVSSCNNNFIDVNNFIEGTLSNEFRPTSKTIVDGYKLIINSTSTAMVGYRVPSMSFDISYESNNKYSLFIYDGASQKKAISPASQSLIDGRFVCNFDFSTLDDPILYFYRGSTDTQIIEIDKISVSVNNSIFKPSQQDKKAILYRDQVTGEWLPVPQLHEWDVVDSLENKWYKRSGKVVLNGSENWGIGNHLAVVDGFTTCYCNIDNYIVITNKETAICDKFSNIQNITDAKEGLIVSTPYITNRGISIRISNSKLETQDVAGFKKWLQSNNVTVVYQLAQEEVFDISPIEVDAYSYETMLSLNAGAITGDMEFSITSYINNLVLHNTKSIRELQNEVFKYVVNQNSIMLDTRYIGDSTAFNFETSVMSARFKSVDEKLYKLIKDVINVGKDTYDRAYLEEIIYFYYMDFRLTDDMFDELLLIIELQHNPPIIPETPEI